MKNSPMSWDLKNPYLLAAQILIVLLMMIWVVELIHFFQPLNESNSQPNPTEMIVKNESITLNSPVFKKSVFGNYLPHNLNADMIKESMLNVEVVGILLSPNDKDSQVILRNEEGEEKIYSSGDSLPAGAIIKRISKEGVVILHNGVLESLSLPKNDLTFESKAKPLIEE